MSRIDELKEALYDWLVDNSGVDSDQIVRSHQNPAEPLGVYLTFDHAMSLECVSVDRVYSATEAKQARIYHWMATASIHAFGTGCRDVLSALKTSLCKNAVIEKFKAVDPDERHQGGFAPHCGDIRFIPGVRGVSVSEHAQMDMFIGFAEVQTDDLEPIENVSAGGDSQIIPDDEAPVSLDPIP